MDLETLRVVGVVGFIGILLFLAGVELNPGPIEVDDLSMVLLPEKWSGHIAAKSTGNGNCLYNSCSLALCGDETLAPNLRHAVAQELHSNASRYGQDHPSIKRIVQEQNMSLSDVVILFQSVLSNPDDEPMSLTLENISECIHAEGLKTYNDKRWASILHVMALSTALGREARSVYPDVPWNYRGLYNTIVQPAGDKSFNFPEQYETISKETIIIFWTRDGNMSQTDHMFVPNHIVPLFTKEAHADKEKSDVEIVSTSTKKRKIQHKLDSYFGISVPSKPNNTKTNAVISPNVSSEVKSNEAPCFTRGVCPDLATLVSRRKQLSEEEKLNILNFNIRRPSTYPSDKSRKFNIAWESNFNWLRYSVSENGVYCASCFVFAQTDVRHAEFICKPFKDWKNAVGEKRGMLPNHANSKTHINATTASVMFLNVYKGTEKSIKSSLSSAYSDQISENRHILKAIIQVITKLSSRGISLRGRWLKEQHREDSNFNFFLEWMSLYDQKLFKHLKSSQKNAKYTSPQFQNEIITCIGDYIRSKIICEVSKSSFFSIMADETTDVSVTEQMSVCVRYIVDKEILEDFIGFVELPRTNAETITNKLVETMKLWNLDLTKWRGKGFDGASTMSGQVSGVQARITNLYPHAKYFTHCKSHCLNLVVVSSCNKVPQIRNFMNTFQELTFFFHNSAKRKTILSRHMSAKGAVSDLLADAPDCEGEDEYETALFENASKRHTLPTLSDTRWLSRIDSISTLLVHYEHIYDALSDVMEESSGQSAADASSFIRSIESFEFIVVACVTQFILAFIRPLSVNLQSKSCDLLQAHTEAATLVSIMKSIRSKNDSFEKIYDRAARIAQQIQVVPEKPRIAGRQKHRANAGENTSVFDHFKLNHFYPFLDHVIQHLNSRFPKELGELLEGTYLLPGHHEHLTSSIEGKLKQTFSNDLPMASQFETEVIRWKHINQNRKTPMSLQEGFGICDKNYFPNINAIFELILSLPVGSCSCERSFSALRRLKTWSRSSMKDSRLNGLALMNIHRNMSLDVEEILKLWDSPGHRRIALAFS